MESGIAGVLVRLSALELGRPKKRPVFTTGDVDRLMCAARRIHRPGNGVTVNSRPTDVAIEDRFVPTAILKNQLSDGRHMAPDTSSRARM